MPVGTGLNTTASATSSTLYLECDRHGMNCSHIVAALLAGRNLVRIVSGGFPAAHHFVVWPLSQIALTAIWSPSVLLFSKKVLLKIGQRTKYISRHMT